MYAFIRGSLVSSTPVEAIVDANGVGYRLHIPTNAQSKLPPPGDEVLFHTAFIVRLEKRREGIFSRYLEVIAVVECPHIGRREVSLNNWVYGTHLPDARPRLSDKFLKFTD